MDRLRRARLYAALPGNTLAGAAARYGIGISALRRAPAVTPSLDDLLLHGLEHPAQAAGLVEWMDYVNHARPSPAEIEAILRRLEGEGLVHRTDRGWVRRDGWP